MSEIRVDTISEKTSANGVAVDGVTIKDGKVTADAGIDIDNFNIDGTTIALSSGSITLDAAGRIDLSADDAGEVRLFDGSSMYGQFKDDDDRLKIQGLIQDKDIMIVGNDGGSEVTAVRFDMSEAGLAIFNAGVALGGTGTANTLDDYEEGTWTPVIKSNNNTISRSGGNEFHTYTKIGRMVNITFTLQAVTLSGTIDNSGDFTYITGLPFTSSSTAGQRSPSTEILYFTSGSKFTEGNVTGTVGPNVSKVEILEHDGAGTGYSSARLANLTSNTYWMFNLTYYV